MEKVFIPWGKPALLGREKEYISEALESGWLSSGEFVDRFEDAFKTFHNTSYGVSTSNGTTAVQLALLSLGIKEGDEVLVPGYTFVSPANMVLAQHARPVFVDIDAKTWCIDTEKIEQHITGKTKAIIAVHAYGNVCDMERINTLAKRYNLFVIEDTAQAVFSRYKGRLAGTLADIGCFSFHSTKTITTGEGGFVLTNHRHLAEKCKKIRNHGMDPKKRYWHDTLGFNFRLSNLQAALGCAQMEQVERIMQDKKRIHLAYKSRLQNVEGVCFQEFSKDVEPVVWSNVIKIDFNVWPGTRDFVLQALLEKGIECRPGFYAFSQMPLYNASKLEVSEAVGKNTINLPSYSTLLSEHIEYIGDSLISLLKANEINV